MLEVTVYTIDPENGELIDNNFDVDYVSLVNHETYGPPALVAPNRGEAPKARPGDSVLFVNTSVVHAFRIDRKDD